MRTFFTFLAFLPIALTIGCSRSETLYPVEGKVLHKGKEAAGVVVTFHRKGDDPVTAVRPVGMTDADGKFTLTTGKSAGAPAGEYTVTFIWPKEVPGKKNKKELSFDMGPGETYDAFEGALADAAKSSIKAEVKQGDTKLDPFRLE
jgi:hypothetical protein